MRTPWAWLTLGAIAAGLIAGRADIWWWVAGFVLVLAAAATFFMRSRLLGPVQSRGKGPGVALTFDDGPTPGVTDALLDLLEEHGAQATFFVVGKKARAHRELLRRCADAGHQIGNHSDQHSYWMNFFFAQRMRRDLAACQETVLETTGTAPICFRPPVGLMNHCTYKVTRALGMTVTAWTVRSFDTVLSTPATARRVLKRSRDGAIILLHDTGDAVATTRLILDGLRQRNLSSVRLDRLG